MKKRIFVFIMLILTCTQVKADFWSELRDLIFKPQKATTENVEKLENTEENIVEEKTNEFLTDEAQLYVSNKKEWFSSIFPECDDDNDPKCYEWYKETFFIHVAKEQNKYKIAYTPIFTEKYDKDGYPILIYGKEKKEDARYDSTLQKKTLVTVPHSFGMDPFSMFTPGTVIKNGKKYNLKDYRIISEAELINLLKSKNARKTSEEVKKGLKEWHGWLIHNFS